MDGPCKADPKSHSLDSITVFYLIEDRTLRAGGKAVAVMYQRNGIEN